MGKNAKVNQLAMVARDLRSNDDRRNAVLSMEAHGCLVKWGEGDAAMIKGKRSKVKREV